METKESQKQEWDDEDVIDVGEILYALLRKLWIIIGALVIGGAIEGHIVTFCSHCSTLQPQNLCTDKRNNADIVGRPADWHAADAGLQDDHYRPLGHGRGSR